MLIYCFKSASMLKSISTTSVLGFPNDMHLSECMKGDVAGTMTQLVRLTCQLPMVLSRSVCDSRCPLSSTVCVTAVSLLTEVCPHCLGRQTQNTRARTHMHARRRVHTQTLVWAKSRLVRGN